MSENKNFISRDSKTPMATNSNSQENVKNESMVQPKSVYSTPNNDNLMAPMPNSLLFPYQENLPVLFSPMPLAIPTSSTRRTFVKKEPLDEASIPPSCVSCGTTQTPLWRRNHEGALECNACNLYYRKNQCSRPVNLAQKVSKRRRRKDEADLPSAKQEPKENEEPQPKKLLKQDSLTLNSANIESRKNEGISASEMPIVPFWPYDPMSMLFPPWIQPSFWPISPMFPYIMPISNWDYNFGVVQHATVASQVKENDKADEGNGKNECEDELDVDG